MLGKSFRRLLTKSSKDAIINNASGMAQRLNLDTREGDVLALHSLPLPL